MADSSDVDAAVIAKLLADPQLMAIVQDGVFFDVAKHGATRFVIVSQMTHEDEYMFGGSAFEAFDYLVKAVVINTSGADVKTAATRIHAVLQDQPLSVTGYSLMRMQRIERVRYTEPDDDNADARWQHRGGRYAVVVSP
jgi:acyl-coenzyme A thioesterase PaaI-like protein